MHEHYTLPTAVGLGGNNKFDSMVTLGDNISIALRVQNMGIVVVHGDMVTEIEHLKAINHIFSTYPLVFYLILSSDEH